MILSMRSTQLGVEYWRIPPIQLYNLPLIHSSTTFPPYQILFVYLNCQALSVISLPLYMLLENSLVYSPKVENTHSLWCRNYIPQPKPTENTVFKKRKETHRRAALFIIAKILREHKWIFLWFYFSWVISTMEYYTAVKKESEYSWFSQI